MIQNLRSSIATLTIGAALGVGLVVGCGPKTPAEDPSANATWNTQYATPTQTAQPTAAPTETATTAPTATAAPTETATAAPLPIDPTVLQSLLTPIAQQQVVAGSKPEGAPIYGILEQGKYLEMTATLAPSGQKCYTGIGVGLPPITDLVVELWTNTPPLPPTIVSQSQTTGNQVVMAGKPNCFKNLLPIPGPVTFRVTARGGSGPVLAQLYAK